MEGLAGTLAVLLTGDYLCAACACGQASLVPVNYALNYGAIACRCGAQVDVNAGLIAQLTEDERVRFERQAAKVNA